MKNYNNDYEHECFNEALPALGAHSLPLIPADGGIQCFSIPGCGDTRFYSHQVWGIYFVVRNILSPEELNNVLVADDMGMGKVSILFSIFSLFSIFRFWSDF